MGGDGSRRCGPKGDSSTSSTYSRPGGGRRGRAVTVTAHSPEHARLLQAAQDGDLAVLREAASSDPGSLTEAVCTSGCSALHWAAGNNQLEVLHFLLSSPNSSSAAGRTCHQSQAPTATTTKSLAFTTTTSSSSSSSSATGIANSDKESSSAVEANGARQSTTEPARRPYFDVNHRAVGPSRGRTALHYASRNGCLEAVQLSVETYGAHPDPQAKQSVTPFQMAVWRNQHRVCRYLVEQCGVDPRQVNDFGCNAAHWACISPPECAGQRGELLLPLLEWLLEQGVNFCAMQRQGHTPLHKAAWLGHLEVVQWLHKRCDLWDDIPDHAGNYCVDLCRMARTPRHDAVALYLRQHCSRDVTEWCCILGVSLEQVRLAPAFDSISGTASQCAVDEVTLRRAYLQRVRQVHPDKQQNIANKADHVDFYQVQEAYQRLLDGGGLGKQGNPAHSLPPLLQNDAEPTAMTQTSSNCALHDEAPTERNVCSNSTPVATTDEDAVSAELSDRFKAQLLAVLSEYGTKGMDVSNVKKKWQQVWGTPFPDTGGEKMARWLSQQAGDVVSIRKSRGNIIVVHPRKKRTGTSLDPTLISPRTSETTTTTVLS